MNFYMEYQIASTGGQFDYIGSPNKGRVQKKNKINYGKFHTRGIKSLIKTYGNFV